MGIEGLKQALKATNQLINIEASNLTRSQIPGAKETRGSLTNNDFIQTGNGKVANGPGIALNATQTNFGIGSFQQTQFATDLAVNGSGFFTLTDSKGRQFYTRRGDFHFDDQGFLANNDGLFVQGVNPQTGQIGKISIEINPIVSPLGQQILDEIKSQGPMKAADLATALGETLPNINAELTILQGANYATSFTQGPDTFYQHNLGIPGDEVQFDNNGFMINATRGLRKGNQLILTKFSNPQGLQASIFGGVIYQAGEVAGPPQVGTPDMSDFGSIQGQALEMSNSSATTSLSFLGLLQRQFTSTAAAMKVFISAIDDLNSIFR